MFRLDKRYREIEILLRRVILFTAALILIIVYFSQIASFFRYVLAICSPFFIGGFLAFIFNTISSNLLKLYEKASRRKENRLVTVLANAAALLLVLSIIVIFLFLIIPHAIDSFQRLAATLPKDLQQLYAQALETTQNIPYLHAWLSNFSGSMEDIPQLITDVSHWVLSGGVGDIMGNLYTMISTTFSWLLTLFLSIAFSIILLFNKKTLLSEFDALVKAYVPAKNQESFRNFCHLVQTTFSHYISGTCTECLILGFLVTIASVIFKIPYSFLCGIIVGIGALVPMFGALAAAILMALFIAISNFWQGATFLVLFLAIQSIEGNFIYPHVVGKFVEFPPMYVIIAITIGANLAGVIGMVISIPICSIVYQLIKNDTKIRIASRSFRRG